MTFLNTLGTISFLFVVAFTYYAYNKEHTIGQSPKSAIIETWMNIIIGFSINYCANIVLLPLVGATVTHSNNFALGWIYTAISMMRQFTIRRWFNAKLHEMAIKLAMKIEK